MVNSGEVNGIPGHLNGFLLTDLLRGELSFNGVVVSDWEDIKKLVNIHNAAATEKDAMRQAVLAGVDMSMVPPDYSFSDLLGAARQGGAVPMSRIDEAVRRILTMKERLGLFDDPLRGCRPTTSVGSPSVQGGARSRARVESSAAQERQERAAARRSTKVLITGPTADTLWR